MSYRDAPRRGPSRPPVDPLSRRADPPAALIGTDQWPFQKRWKRGDVPHRRAGGSNVQVAKVGSRVDLEVVVPDVAPADDGQGVVHHQGLIVHAVIEALEVPKECGNPALRAGKGIDHPDLDVRVGIRGGEGRVPALKVRSSSRTRTRTPPSAARTRRSARSRRWRLFPDEVLHVERLLGEIGERGPGRKGNLPAADDREAGLAGVARGGFFDVATERGAGLVLEGLWTRCRVVLRHAGAAGDRHESGDQQGANAQHRRAQAMLTRGL